jgi:DNA repair exonuclease SbcCD ATPase subunit
LEQGGGGGADNLIKFLSESIGPALSHASEEALLLRQDNRKLRTMLDLGTISEEGGGDGHGTVGVAGGLQKRLKEEVETKAALVKDIVVLQAQLQQVQAQLDLRDEALKKAYGEVKTLQVENAALLSERTSFIELHGGQFENELKAAMGARDEAHDLLQKQNTEMQDLETRAAEAKEQLEDMEREFLSHKHMTSETQTNAEEALAQCKSELQSLQEAYTEIQNINTEMQDDLREALSELQASRSCLETTQNQLRGEKESAVTRFKLWEQELETRASEVQTLTDRLRDAGGGGGGGSGGEGGAEEGDVTKAADGSGLGGDSGDGEGGRDGSGEGGGHGGVGLPRDTERRLKLLEELRLSQERLRVAEGDAERARDEGAEVKRDLALCLCHLQTLQIQVAQLSAKHPQQQQQQAC